MIEQDVGAPVFRGRFGHTRVEDVRTEGTVSAETSDSVLRGGETGALEARVEALLAEHLESVHRRVDARFAVLMVGQWLVAIAVAAVLSPFAWQGASREVHPHLQVAVVLGGLLSAFPLVLVRVRPGELATRHVVAVAQMLWAALFIHLTGGRIETHFYVFGSLAFLAFYRDPAVMATATVTAVLEHVLRGIWWPESIFGVANPAWWRFLEHAFWMVFVNGVLVIACRETLREMRRVAVQQVLLEGAYANERVDHEHALARARREMSTYREQAARVEKLAAVGRMTATVGHELRNPLAAARTANAVVVRHLRKLDVTLADQRLQRFLEIIERELAVCSRISSELLDFARERPLELRPCSLHALMEEVLDVVPRREGVHIHNNVPPGMDPPWVDRELLRKVLINLVQNAVEAMPQGRVGRVEVSAEDGGGGAFILRVSDNGMGIPESMQERIFEPLFSTKPAGTGLGLSVVASTVRQHGGTLRVESREGEGSSFTLCLPSNSPGAEVAV
ncbi:sensor histidine kinase [Myxococcus hansupus]|uniref:histidine kinase n=1 Tax=Pseudomyxococcus hansupus TaxID=1297742 RepID=A0A0H4XFT4_9BACT|nr:sensor histidine kinase [Myxococcus hansupus]